MKILIGIDDTDNLQSRGTGFLARRLGEKLAEAGLAVVSGITRHQLLVHDDIPYTSHNSSACIASEGNEIEKINYLCRNFVRSECAKGSDAGLCVAQYDRIDEEITGWGQRAKKEVLKLDQAGPLAEKKGLFLEGLSGTHGGMIGALAAVGLHKSGNDGRFLWVKGMRKYMGVMNCSEIFEETGVEEIRFGSNVINENKLRILLPEWWRPVLKDHKKVLFVEPSDNNYYEFQLIPKDHLKRISG